MTRLERLLVRVPAVYAELGRGMLPGRSGEPPDTSPDPRHRPAPARLDAVEHRHQLLRGLRWWVDAVVDPDERRFVIGLGDSPARMCALLLANVGSMADEDRAELDLNLWDWIGAALPLVGDVATPRAPALPREALDQRVPVHVAAKALGVSVSTVKRRTPGREGGVVLLRDAAGELCPMSDLPPAWCAHCCRTGCATGA